MLERRLGPMPRQASRIASGCESILVSSQTIVYIEGSYSFGSEWAKFVRCKMVSLTLNKFILANTSKTFSVSKSGRCLLWQSKFLSKLLFK